MDTAAVWMVAGAMRLRWWSLWVIHWCARRLGHVARCLVTAAAWVDSWRWGLKRQRPSVTAFIVTQVKFSRDECLLTSDVLATVPRILIIRILVTVWFVGLLIMLLLVYKQEVAGMALQEMWTVYHIW